MADDDFDIDIYGDTEDMPTSTSTLHGKDAQGDTKIEDHVEARQKPNDHEADAQQDNQDMENHNESHDDSNVRSEATEERAEPSSDVRQETNAPSHGEEHQQIKSTDESGKGAIHIPKQAPVQQGTKRKEGSDERAIDPGATTAILISDLHWWNTDDDIRGWVNQAHCEDELKDITFSEHKVNGKSKGQAYVEFTSQQAATAAKHKIDAFGEGQQYVKRHAVTYSNPNINPFKTLPKDVPAKANRDMAGGRGGFQQSGGYNNGGFRGRGGFRGGMGGGFSRTGFPGGMNGGFQPQSQMGGFQGNMGRGGFNQGAFSGGMNGMNGMNMRGGPNMRGGRGGMNGGMGMGMPMAGMTMGGMPMGGMGGGFPPGGMNAFAMGQPHFNPAFFSQNQGGAGDWQNPHGAKRPREN